MDSSEPNFDNKYTQAFGTPIERVKNKTNDFLTGPIKDSIAESPFLVMATSSSDGRCDASPKGGKPGFVRVLDDSHLLVPDVLTLLEGHRARHGNQNEGGNDGECLACAEVRPGSCAEPPRRLRRHPATGRRHLPVRHHLR